jgi:hypothetical protein
MRELKADMLFSLDGFASGINECGGGDCLYHI